MALHSGRHDECHVLAMLLWLFLLPLARAETVPSNQRCVVAVYTAYNYLTFAGPWETLWSSRCQNPLEVISIYAASDTYCPPGEKAPGTALLDSLCQELAQTDIISREQLADNLTDDAIKRMKVVEYGELPRREALDEAVLISPAYFERTFRTVDDLQEVNRSHRLYGYVCYSYWATILCFGVLYRLFQTFWKNRRVAEPPWTLFQRFSHAVQTHLVIAKPTPFFWLTLPSRLDAIVLGLFWVLNTVLCAISYPTFEGNLYWPPVYKQYLRYVADRTGVLSFANLPLLWIFAGRNNIFLWATGWNFARFNIFHRHVAVISVVQAVVHTVLYIVLFVDGGTFWKKINRPYLLWGTLATVVMILLLPMSLQCVRHRTYELFLVFHIVASVVGLVACFYHTIIFQDLEYWDWLWPAVIIWIIDRSLRVVRLLYCNLYVHVTRCGQLQRTRSSATYDETSNIVWLQVRPGTEIQTGPGDYFYLYQPFRFTGWESHPFTVGALSYGPEAAATKLPSGDVAQVPLLSGELPGADSPDDTAKCVPDASGLLLTFWIRPYDGWTRHLREECLRSPDRTTRTTILLEGPYGGSFPMWNYESVLFVVGGTGIAAAVPYIQDHLHRSATGTTRTHSVHLAWTSRQVSFLTDIAISSDLRSALAREDVRASFYATDSSHDGPAADEPALADLGLEISTGRPDLALLVNEHAREARLSDCTAAVLVCGPRGMAEETRKAVYGAMRQGYEMRYVEESFFW